VYGEIVKPEVSPAEADRFLFYDRCLGCHATPADLGAPAAADWRTRVELERAREGVELTDDEAERLTRYLDRGAP
jgi:hypothetical protein